MRLVELRLREERQQAVVAAVAVDDQNFLAAVARHLVGGLLQQGELHGAAVGHGAGLVPGLGDLTEIIFGENDGVFLLGGMQRGIADVEKIGAERKMRAVLLQDSEREQACSLGTANAFAKVGGGEFFPVGGKLGGLRLRQADGSQRSQEERKRTEIQRVTSSSGNFLRREF